MFARTRLNATLYLYFLLCLYFISIFRQEKGRHLFLPDVKVTLKSNVSCADIHMRTLNSVQRQSALNLTMRFPGQV